MENALNVGPKLSTKTDAATVQNADGLLVKIKNESESKINADFRSLQHGLP